MSGPDPGAAGTGGHASGHGGHGHGPGGHDLSGHGLSGHGHGVVITTRDIYDKVVEVGSKVDGVVAAQERIREQVIDHEQRLRATERWRYALPVALLLGLLSAGSTLLSTLA